MGLLDAMVNRWGQWSRNPDDNASTDAYINNLAAGLLAGRNPNFGANLGNAMASAGEAARATDESRLKKRLGEGTLALESEKLKLMSRQEQTAAVKAMMEASALAEQHRALGIPLPPWLSQMMGNGAPAGPSPAGIEPAGAVAPQPVAQPPIAPGPAVDGGPSVPLGNGKSLSLADAIRLKVLGNKDLTGAVLQANQPTTVPAGGAAITPMGRTVFGPPNLPQGMAPVARPDGSVDPAAAQEIPGVAGFLQRIEQGKERAKAGMSLAPADVRGPNGQPLTVEQVADAARSGGRVQMPPTTAEAKQTDMLAENWVKQDYNPVIEGRKVADQMMTDVATARAGLKQMGGGQGFFDAHKVQLASVLGALGVKQAEEYASGGQKFQQAASSRLWVILNAAKGPQTEGDATRAAATWARLSATPEANAYLLDLAEAVAVRDRLKADFYEKAKRAAVASKMPLDSISEAWSQYEPSIGTIKGRDGKPIMSKWGL